MRSKRSGAVRIGMLQRRLAAESDRATRAWWERYLKGSVAFRGVPMAKVRASMHAWYEEDGVAALSARDQKEAAIALLREPFAEDKLAGILALQERLLPALDAADIRAIGAVFGEGHITDWSTCDWLCVKVLGRLVAQGPDHQGIARALAAWCHEQPLWQRRASVVAFVKLAKRGDENFPGFSELLLGTSAIVVQSAERFAQTGVGWALRELSIADLEAVAAFARVHAARLSREAMRYLVQKMPAPRARELLALQPRSARS